jgi:hypothetical protein
MIRDIDLVSYLPPFMADFREMSETMKAEDREFKIVWDATNRALSNEFIATADEYGISRFEKILGIHPDAEDDLEMRRLRVQSRWFNTLPYTIRTFTRTVSRLLGETYNFSILSAFGTSYEMILTVYTAYDDQMEELKNTISIMVPANIVVGIVCEEVCEGNVYCGVVAEEGEIIEIIQR